MDRSLWQEAFALDRPPRFPCPSCSWNLRGRLHADASSLRVEYPPTARAIRQRGGGLLMMPEASPRFQLSMRCDDPICGEVVAVAGTVAPWETEVNGRALGYNDALYPAFFFPAPPIIEFQPTKQGVSPVT
jgi:hypothetical protein